MFTITSTSMSLKAEPDEDGIQFFPSNGESFVLDMEAARALASSLTTMLDEIEAKNAAEQARKRANSKPLGKTQKGVLQSLKDHGSWYQGCGWIWDSTSLTIRILDSLVIRGLVEVKDESAWAGLGQSHRIARKTYRLVENN